MHEDEAGPLVPHQFNSLMEKMRMGDHWMIYVGNATGNSEQYIPEHENDLPNCEMLVGSIKILDVKGVRTRLIPCDFDDPDVEGCTKSEVKRIELSKGKSVKELEKDLDGLRKEWDKPFKDLGNRGKFNLFYKDSLQQITILKKIIKRRKKKQAKGEL